MITTAEERDRFSRVLRRNVSLPLGLGLGSALLFIFLVLYLLSTIDEVERTDRVLARSYAAQKLDVEMEASFRGYMLAGEPRFMENYRQAEAAHTVERAELGRLTAGAPQQQARLARVNELLLQWTRWAEVHIAAKRQDPAYQLGSRTEEGRALKEAVRDEYDRFVEQEQRLRQERVQTVSRNTYSVLIGFAALMLLMGGLLAWRGKKDLTTLSAEFEGTLTAEREQRDALSAQAWLREGQSQLAEKLSGEQALDALGHETLDFLSGYLGAAVGAVYVTGPDARQWQRAATWGWDPQQDDRRRQLGRGDTLLAECASRRQAIVLDPVPQGYLQVTSSLGEADTHAVLLAPLIYQRRLAGVLELGFLRPLQPRDRELLDSCGSIVAAAIEAAVYRERLQTSLEETQQLNEELQVQQEELRTANEELEEHTKALRESQAQLESQQAELEQTNLQLSEFAGRLEAQRDELKRAQGQLEERAADLERASRYKSEFLANMSHELRTPLNSALILAKLLADNRKGNLDAEDVKYAESIYSAGNDLLNLINDILDIAKVEAGRLELRPETTSVAALVEGLRDLFTPQAARKNLGFRIDVDAAVPPTLYTDRQRLEQVLRNLLGNAIKFTDRGEVSLRVQPGEAGGLRFQVSDSGIGIDPSQHQVIFEAFRQADGTTSRRYGGTGLGLSISRDLARLLGGDITLASQPGAGSTFSLSVPLEYRPAAADSARAPTVAAPAAAPASPPAQPVAAARAPSAEASSAASPSTHPFEDDRTQPREGRRCVLVIEDDPMFSRILYDLAHELGYMCLCAPRAEEGLSLAVSQQPDAVLLDMRLPDGSGLSVLQRLKEHPQTRHLPVHALSVEDFAETALQMGAVGYMLKPANRGDLQEVFSRLEAKLAQRVKRVLVVEDDPRQQEGVRALIADQDVEITLAGTGAQALDALAASVYDCMIIDLALPDMSGQELLKRMAAGHGQSFPPVIVYTGRNLTREEEAELLRYSRSIIIKGARSPERLLDEVTLFLHKVESELSTERQRMLRVARSREKAFEGRRILVVDDDVRNVFALTSALEQKGATVEVGRNGREALERLQQVDVDLVLMDIMMPEMDGYTAMREIRKKSQWQRLPIIAITAKAMRDDQERCLAAGANDYLAKPIDLERLFSLMRVWMPKMERI